ncbi:Bax inhibitor-1/YccA family protein [Pseudomonas sp. BMS12]|uniref:Bax inhibitor-1/YccA family protein n=1 Tax=Pseudomonas sp. BMS12 TaxID=1796033 RepID=UPI00083B0BAB|nr:Bax inhibitor-1/YccA family protein [Pseudomonas sp. BMS12]
MASGNPSLSEQAFSDFDVSANPMTLGGTVNKTAMLLALMLIPAVWVWGSYFSNPAGADRLLPLLIGAALGGFVLSLIIIFVKRSAPYLAPLYALLEGVFIGAISAFYEAKYPGIVIQAVALTFGTLFCLLAAYRSGLIRATENFKLGVTAATGAIALLYLVNLCLRLFTDLSIPFIHEIGTLGICFSLFVVVIAALNLVLDFDFIEQGVEQQCPKYMEWYAAFGLMLTLVWLYLEILRLLAKLRK